MPVQPNSASQVAARARLTTYSASWRGLTEAQRAAWAAFANSFTVVNSLGLSVNLTGHQAYVKVNTVNTLLAQAAVTAPPALPAFIANTVTGLTALFTGQAMTLTGAAPAAGTYFMVYASGQRSAGVSFEGDFRYLVAFTNGAAFPFNLATSYVAKYGALIAGKKIFVKVVQSIAGMQDNGTLFSVIVGA